MSPKKSNPHKSSPSIPPTAEVKKRSNLVTIIAFCLVFAIAWIPLILSVSGLGIGDQLPFSIYNSSSYPGDGCSQLREALENTNVNIGGTTVPLNVHPLISSLSVINSINRNSVLCVIGPTHGFSFIEASALIDFFQRGGCLVIADDFGSGNTILDSLALILLDFPAEDLGFTRISAVRFDKRLLLDAGSNDGGRPLLPLITGFSDPLGMFPTTQRVVMNYATGIIAPSGTLTPLASTSSNSWLTHDRENPAYNQSRGDQAGTFTLMGIMGIGNGLLVLISDPSIFVNDMLNREDNRTFAVELFTYLAQYANADTIVVDHNHLSWIPSAPVLLVGLMLGQITYVSSNWLLAPLAPLVALWMVRKYLPFGKPAKQTPEIVYRLRGGTLFTKTLREFIDNQRYDEAVRIIYGQLKRDLTRKHGLRSFDVSSLLVKISKIRQPTDLSVLSEDLEALEDAVISSRHIDRDKFLDLFFKINRIRENIG